MLYDTGTKPTMHFPAFFMAELIETRFISGFRVRV